MLRPTPDLWLDVEVGREGKFERLDNLTGPKNSINFRIGTGETGTSVVSSFGT